MQVVVYAGIKEKQVLAGAFASLPVKVLWHATQREMDDATLNQLSLGSNTKGTCCQGFTTSDIVSCIETQGNA